LKKPIIYSFIFLISLIAPLPAFSQWEKIFSTDNADFYFDNESIKKTNRYVYWWDLVNYNEKQPEGSRSWKTFNQGDCEEYRTKTTKSMFYDKKWGEGNRLNLRTKRKINEWRYPNPKFMSHGLLKKICNY